MRTFADANNRIWYVAINVTAVRRVRAAVQVDLCSLGDNGFAELGKLLGDPVTLCNVLYVLCRDDAEQRNVSDEEFGRALFGDVIFAAREAFVEELIDFFPDARTRAALRKVMEKSKTVGERVMDQLETQLDAIDADAEATQLTKSLTNSPESSVSTQGPSPCDSLT